MKDTSLLEKILNVTFKKQEILQQAVVHRSYLNENPDFHLGHNERLEFLGDAVLELVVTEHLYNNYPNPEGELTNWRASLVNAKMLAVVARDLGFEDFLYMSRGEAADVNSKARDYILANVFESIVGAIYLDGGYNKCYKFIDKILIPKLKYIIENNLYKDPKSKFQELSQEKLGITPNYRVLEETGPDHERTFRVGVYLGSQQCGIGSGLSKKEAQEIAAREALKMKKWE